MTARDELERFVREALNGGASREEVSAALRGAGWAEAQVMVALAGFAEVDFPIAVPRPRPSVSAREAFEYVVLFGTLYFAAFNLGLLLFQFIDLAFPDPLWSAGTLPRGDPSHSLGHLCPGRGDTGVPVHGVVERPEHRPGADQARFSGPAMAHLPDARDRSFSPHR